LQQKLAQMQTAFAKEQGTAGDHPQQAYQQLESLKKDARKAAGTAMREAAPRLMEKLKKEKSDNLLLEVKFIPLEGLFAAAEACVKDGKPAADITQAYRTFFDETSKVQTERDRLKAAWDPIAKQYFGTKAQMENLVSMAELIKLDSVATAAAAAQK